MFVACISITLAQAVCICYMFIAWFVVLHFLLELYTIFSFICLYQWYGYKLALIFWSCLFEIDFMINA